MKYSDYFMDILKEQGYTHCFFVPGGNVMHLLESARTRFQCISNVHEVSSVIGAEYFNEASRDNSQAFALVTAGPGITNTITGIASSWLESRHVLIVGGQAKVSDLSDGSVRQIGHQEIGGVSLTSSITKVSRQIKLPIPKNQIIAIIDEGRIGRPGPVFIEMCLDVSALIVPVINETQINKLSNLTTSAKEIENFMQEINELLTKSERPLILLGGGLNRELVHSLSSEIFRKKIPIAATFNGADRAPYDYAYFCGRPNWYGMRWANLLIQQCDLLITLGTRLGIQQTGFNWEEFAANAKVVQVDIDENELRKGFPQTELAIKANANDLLPRLIESYNLEPKEWLSFIEDIREGLDNPEKHNNRSGEGFIELQSFLYDLSDFSSASDVIIPCSSGGSFTGMMQMFRNKLGQRIITDSNLASMGYGLPGAIGASLANPTNRVILVEGDGGFAQNMQEMGTVVRNKLNLKIFLIDNGGYGTIKNSQRASFDGNFIGCDSESGLLLPKWETFFLSYGIHAFILTPDNKFTSDFEDKMKSDTPQVFIVKIDPNQEFYPKIVSRKNENGKIVSNPLHLMNPPLSDTATKMYMPWIN